MKYALGDFNAKSEREVIFKQTIGTESLHQEGNDSPTLISSTMFPHRNIHKYTWTSLDGQTNNEIDHILIDMRRHSSTLDV